VTGCCFEVCRVRDGSMDSIGINVFDCADVVVDCLMVAACSMADGPVDTANCDSSFIVSLAMRTDSKIIRCSMSQPKLDLGMDSSSLSGELDILRD